MCFLKSTLFFIKATKGNRFFMKPEDLIMEVVNEDENKRQSKHSNNSSIKKERDSSDAQQIHRSSNTKNIDWNVMLEDNLETKSSLKYQQKSDQTPQNIDDNMLDSIIKEEIEVEIQHIKDSCEQTHENGLTNKVKKDKSLENGMCNLKIIDQHNIKPPRNTMIGMLY